MDNFGVDTSSANNWSRDDSWTEEAWNLDITEARDRFNQVKWTNDYEQQLVPPLIMFGYFPYAADVPQTWRPSKLSIHRYLAFRYIFKTGNKNPPLPFETSYDSLDRKLDQNSASSLNSLARWRCEREFRACMWLHQIRLWRLDAVVRFSMSGFFETGWTPPRVNSLAERSAFPSLKGKYVKGQGILWPKQVVVNWQPWGAHIKVSAGFRINERMARIGNYLFWGRGVPFMRITLDLQVRCDGSHRVAFNGSYIPSQVCQVANEYNIYDMIRDIGGYREVKRALGVGFGKPAPERQTAIERIIP